MGNAVLLTGCCTATDGPALAGHLFREGEPDKSNITIPPTASAMPMSSSRLNLSLRKNRAYSRISTTFSAVTAETSPVTPCAKPSRIKYIPHKFVMPTAVPHRNVFIGRQGTEEAAADTSCADPLA